MVNKTQEAFKDWLKFISVELTGMDLKIAEAAWQAAIAYMQEQSDKDNSLQKAFDLTRNTTPQRQQPLKRLDEITIDEIFSTYTDEQGYVAIDDWHLLTNAIMDEMERLNKL